MSMIPGTVVNVGGTEYVVPPFNIAMWERPEFNADPDPNEKPPELLRRIGPALLDNLARNYPEIDKNTMLADLDMPTFLELRGAGMAMRHAPANPPNAPAA
jgi:hypothetical protein